MISLSRFVAVALKELIQMRRDRLTFAMMVGIPILQLLLFGYAINTDPKRLPTAVLSFDNSRFSRSFTAALQTSGYFDLSHFATSEEELDRWLATGEVQFAVHIPPGFSRSLLRGERPQLLVEADATDPAATGNALAALSTLAGEAFKRDLTGPLEAAIPVPPPVDIRVHRRYNPEGITAFNIVPGLIGTILTMTMIIMTALAVTRERERGTMEALLAMPVRPAEVMLGKLVPYIGVGIVQVAVIMVSAALLFSVPMAGSATGLVLGLLAFIVANLAVGFLFSTVARNQLQAMQMSFFFFLPSILLSGFMFPFRGMPDWAQVLGEILPLTHFLRIVRGIMLKGNGLAETWPELLPLLAFMAVAMLVALRKYRETLD